MMLSRLPLPMGYRVWTFVCTMPCNSSRLVPTAIPVSITRGTHHLTGGQIAELKEVTQDLARFTPSAGLLPDSLR